MRVAQALSGYTLEQADILRAAMGKKNKVVMEKERERFMQGAIDNGVDQQTAQTIFEQIETFASYGFNRSHAAAYSLTTYITAYLKAHFPYEFMAALTSLDMDDVDKTYKNIAALRDMGIRLLPPDVNESRIKFTIAADAIRFGLCAIRGVGAKTAEAIIAARESGGPFTSLTDLCMRADPQQINRKVLEALVKCGAFDSTGVSRAEAMAQVEDALKLVARRADPTGANQMGLFGAMAPALRTTARGPVASWDLKELLRAEKEALGFYVTAHPLDKYAGQIRRLSDLTTQDLGGAPDGSQVVLVGVVQSVKLKNNKAGKRYATFSLEDLHGAVEVIAWPETYQRTEAAINSDEPVVARGKLDIDEDRAQILLDELRPLSVVLVDSIREVHIRAPKAGLDESSLQSLKALFSRHGGACPIYLHLEMDPAREAIFLLGNDFRVAPTEGFVGEVEQMLAPGAVELRAQQGAAI